MIEGFDARHIVQTGPAGQVAIVVFWEAIEAATGDGSLDPGVEDGEEHGVVSAE